MAKTCIVDQLPTSKLAYFVKKQTYLPTGCRYDHMPLEEAWYWVMQRPVNPRGQKSNFYGTKVQKFKGPFVGAEGLAKAKEIAKIRNETHHVIYV
jgi:hypothetical protein